MYVLYTDLHDKVQVKIGYLTIYSTQVNAREFRMYQGLRGVPYIGGYAVLYLRTMAPL